VISDDHFVVDFLSSVTVKKLWN